MMYSKSILLALASASTLLGGVSADSVPQGFNCGNQAADGTMKQLNDYVQEFTAAQNLPGTNGAFSSARLYTMIQGGGSSPTAYNEAFEAAVKTKTSLLLGMWCSGDPSGFQNELTAFENALKAEQAGTLKGFSSLINGISVGSEDLYRDSPIGIENKSGVGLGPDGIVSYIKQVRQLLSKYSVTAKVGHVDTWTAWVNGTNKEVIDNCDWVGVDAYPYWQSTMNNPISIAGSLFFDAVDKTKAAAGDKPVWITETGWPVKGNQSNAATASVENAKAFYQGVGCKILGSTPCWWYILNENGASPDFSVTGPGYKPLFDLSCADAKKENASPLLASSNADNSTSSSGNGTASESGSSGSGSSASSTASGASASSTHKPSGASATHAANCMFALVLAGVVAFMI